MNQDVTNYMDEINELWQKELAVQLREAVHRAIPDVQERIQYKKPHFLKHGKYAAVISISKEAVSFTIFHTAGLELPEEMFDGPPERKTAKFKKGSTLDAGVLEAWVKQASSTL
ncbi:DUF1801 domain-containing protein [Paenibacillus septentrionalis]|uniref:DUF1801 domain-containing protein n=1 Tax=Paenibacillus septentrionalis TaxID=429342 RepID=A0ABW1V459_9BACL